MSRTIAVLVAIDVAFFLGVAVALRAAASFLAASQIESLGADFPGWFESVLDVMADTHFVAVWLIGLLAATWALVGEARSMARDMRRANLIGWGATVSLILLYLLAVWGHVDWHSGDRGNLLIWAVAVALWTPVSIYLARTITAKTSS